jgi:hypothetical protein
MCNRYSTGLIHGVLIWIADSAIALYKYPGAVPHTAHRNMPEMLIVASFTPAPSFHFSS